MKKEKAKKVANKIEINNQVNKSNEKKKLKIPTLKITWYLFKWKKKFDFFFSLLVCISENMQKNK